MQTTISAQWQKPALRSLLLFTLAVIVVTLFGEAFKTHLLWYIRYADLTDLIFIPILYLISLTLFFDLFQVGNASPGFRRLFLGLVFVYFFGLGMRVASNTINVFSTEIRDYSTSIPTDAYSLIYFFDETLAHLIIYITRYCLFACLLVLEVRCLACQPAAKTQWLALGTGVLFGLWEAIVFVEGQKVLLAPFLVAGLAVVWFYLWKKSSSTFSNYLKTGPLTAFTTTLIPSLLLGLILYMLITGGFGQPSQL